MFLGEEINITKSASITIPGLNAKRITRNAEKIYSAFRVMRSAFRVIHIPCA